MRKYITILITVVLLLSLCAVGCTVEEPVVPSMDTNPEIQTENESRTEVGESDSPESTVSDTYGEESEEDFAESQYQTDTEKSENGSESESDSESESESNGIIEGESECEAHSFGIWTVVKLPSCTEEGRRERTCSCGAVEYELFDKLDHEYGEWKQKGASPCAETIIYQRICSCGAIDTKTEAGQGHTAKIINGKFPTDTLAGYSERAVCTVCGKVLRQSIDVPAITTVEVDVLSSVTYEGNSDGVLTFRWNVAPEYEGQLFGMNVSVSNGSKTVEYQIFDHEGTWKFQAVGNLVRYIFKFVPITHDGVAGNEVETTYFWFKETYTTEFPRVEVNTLNGELPTFTKTTPPEGCWGGGITDANYVQSIVSLYDENNTLLYTSMSSGYEGAKVKVRGNTSAYGSKQPFKIKLKQSFDLLGGLIEREDSKDYKNREWLLLKGGEKANIAVGSEISELVGNSWTPQYSYVMLFFNGEYRGLYVLMESVDTAEARCNVSESGYIIEMDAYWWNEPLYFTTPLCINRPEKFTFKYPDSDEITQSSAEYAYIKQYMTDFENVMFGNSKGDINDYIDMESFVKWQMTHDILASWDSGGSNMYITKYDNTSSSKIMAGPVWDYDSIYWSREKFKVDTFARIRYEQHYYSYFLAEYPEYLEIYRDRYDEIRDDVIPTIETTFAQFDNDTYRRLQVLEKSRWGSAIEDPTTTCTSVTDWMAEHLDWMDENIDYAHGKPTK